jgi:hypothetical protein
MSHEGCPMRVIYLVSAVEIPVIVRRNFKTKLGRKINNYRRYIDL